MPGYVVNLNENSGGLAAIFLCRLESKNGQTIELTDAVSK